MSNVINACPFGLRGCTSKIKLEYCIQKYNSGQNVSGRCVYSGRTITDTDVKNGVQVKCKGCDGCTMNAWAYTSWKGRCVK